MVDHKQNDELQEQVVNIGRVSKTVKGGKNFSFSTLAVAGNGEGKVGYGHGKALEVASSIKKAAEEAKRNLTQVIIQDGTIPHEIKATYGASTVMLRPAPAGTGVIAGRVVRTVLECAGYTDIVTKVIGSTNAHNTVKAVFKAFADMQDLETSKKVRA